VVYWLELWYGVGDRLVGVGVVVVGIMHLRGDLLRTPTLYSHKSGSVDSTLKRIGRIEVTSSLYCKTYERGKFAELC
jgi:hypothetical protein